MKKVDSYNSDVITTVLPTVLNNYVNHEVFNTHKKSAFIKDLIFNFNTPKNDFNGAQKRMNVRFDEETANEISNKMFQLGYDKKTDFIRSVLLYGYVNCYANEQLNNANADKDIAQKRKINRYKTQINELTERINNLNEKVIKYDNQLNELKKQTTNTGIKDGIDQDDNNNVIKTDDKTEDKIQNDIKGNDIKSKTEIDVIKKYTDLITVDDLKNKMKEYINELLYDEYCSYDKSVKREYDNYNKKIIKAKDQLMDKYNVKNPNDISNENDRNLYRLYNSMTTFNFNEYAQEYKFDIIEDNLFDIMLLEAKAANDKPEAFHYIEYFDRSTDTLPEYFEDFYDEQKDNMTKCEILKYIHENNILPSESSPTFLFMYLMLFKLFNITDESSYATGLSQFVKVIFGYVGEINTYSQDYVDTLTEMHVFNQIKAKKMEEGITDMKAIFNSRCIERFRNNIYINDIR